MKHAKLISSLFFIWACHCRSQTVLDSTTILSDIKKIRNLESRDIDSSERLARQCYARSLRANYKPGVSKALIRLANSLMLKGQNDSALIYFGLALTSLRENKNPADEAEAYEKLSVVYRTRNQRDSIFLLLFKALKLYENLKDSAKLGSVYNSLGDLNFKYGDKKKATTYLSKAKGLLTRSGDSLALATTFLNYGIVHYYSDEYNLALNNFLRAKSLHEFMNHRRFMAMDLNYLGLCYEALGKDKLARKCFKDALIFFDKLGMFDEKTEVLYNTGVYFLNREQTDSAIFYFEKVLVLLKDTKLNGVKATTCATLADAYSRKGNYAKAYDFQIKYSELNDSLLNTEKVKSIAEMQTKYETEKKEQQIVLLDQQTKTRSAQRNFFIAGSIVLLLGLFVLGFYYVQRGRLAKKNEQIAQEKISGLLKEQEIKTYNAMIEGQEEERKRIATDLHDRLGSMLSTVKLLFSSLNDKIDRNQEETQKQQTKVTSLLDEAVLEVRRVSHNLSTGMVNTFGLITALEELCESVDKSGIVRCRLLSYGMEERLPSQIEIGLFRMVQELVNNALKHSKAKQLTIQLNRTDESLNLTVEDDGVGFDVAEKQKSGGMGLGNLAARAARLGAAYHVDSRPGKGTISIIEIPLKEQE